MKHYDRKYHSPRDFGHSRSCTGNHGESFRTVNVSEQY
jgi:hypothetical protein